MATPRASLEQSESSETNVSTVRVRIFYFGDNELEICNEIFNHVTSRVEERTSAFLSAEISLTDFQELTSKGLLVDKIAKIPTKAGVPFEIPPSGGHFELLIPSLPNSAHQQMISLGFEILERIGSTAVEGISCDKYLVYLTAAQVTAAYNLPFVHSVLVHPVEFNRQRILDIMAKDVVTVECLFTTTVITEQAMIHVANTWKSRTHGAIEPYVKAYAGSKFGIFKAKLSQPTDMTYVDELANMSGVRSVDGSDGYRSAKLGVSRRM
jgi:hypothetical protein